MTYAGNVTPDDDCDNNDDHNNVNIIILQQIKKWNLKQTNKE